MNGRELHFHLAGINNQNFLMRDEETGSYWQQVTGTAIAGPLKGEQLTLVRQDELTFGLWKKEQPNGSVLAPLAQYASKYDKATWESEIAKMPTVIHAPKGTLSDRETILGVVINNEAKAYPLSALTAQSPVLVDSLAGEAIMLALGPDGKSVRIFSREVNSRTFDFYRNNLADAGDSWSLIDENTLSEWGFDGCSTAGEMKGQCLAQIGFLKDYWFDWQHYHPHSLIYRH
jgi:hypothetical protein